MLFDQNTPLQQQVLDFFANHANKDEWIHWKVLREKTGAAHSSIFDTIKPLVDIVFEELKLNSKHRGRPQTFWRLLSHDPLFIPCSNGCATSCPIPKKEVEICCETGRVCCFACLDAECIIAEKWKSFIKIYNNLPKKKD